MKNRAPTFREIVQSYLALIDEAVDWSDETEEKIETEFWAEVKDGGHAVDPECTDLRHTITAIMWKTGQERPDVEPPCITPRTLKAAMLWLRGLKFRFDDGEREALMETIQACAMFNVPIPDWARLEFVRCSRKYETFRAKDLGEAFGVTRPKGAWHSAAKRRHDLLDRLYMAVQYRHEYFGESLGHGMNSLWPRVAKHFGLSVPTARNYYYGMTELERLGAISEWHRWKEENAEIIGRITKDKNSAK
jgi:hypothetical protein